MSTTSESVRYRCPCGDDKLDNFANLAGSVARLSRLFNNVSRFGEDVCRRGKDVCRRGKNVFCRSKNALCVTLPLASLLLAGLANADVWVFEPSIGLDQRIDSNFRIDPFRERGVAATRAVASGELSRENKTFAFRGQARVDALLAVNEDTNDELSSNQIVFLDAKRLRPRSAYGITFSFRRDTPSRDISADITDLSQTASDTGASVTQDENVSRRRFVVNPEYSYKLSRLSEISFGFTYTDVSHGLPSVQDAIDRQVQAIIANENAPQEVRETLQNLGRPAEINDIGRFTIADELDDFTESLIEINYRRQLSRIDTFSSLVSFSAFEAQSEVVDAIEADRNPDPRQENILRNPRVATTVDTIRLVLGYERLFSPTLTGGIQVGYFTADSDAFGEQTSNDGYTAVLSARKNAGIHQFSGRFGIEIFPSDIGDVVESLEAIGDYERQITRLATFNFRMRAFEPDAVSDNNNSDRFARRFFSMEPKIIWGFKRGWTAAGAYRYRRQKSQAETQSGESHALLFSINYSPPSAIADARRAGGITNE